MIKISFSTYIYFEILNKVILQEKHEQEICRI